MKAGSLVTRIPGVRTAAALLTSGRYRVEGSSMEPAYPAGHCFLVDRLTYRRRGPARGEVVVFTHPGLDGKALMKRVVGLPGERVQIAGGRTFIDGVALTEPLVEATDGVGPAEGLEWGLGPDEWFVLGDRRGDSLDSRRLGPVRREWLVGRVWLRWWPPF